MPKFPSTLGRQFYSPLPAAYLERLGIGYTVDPETTIHDPPQDILWIDHADYMLCRFVQEGLVTQAQQDALARLKGTDGWYVLRELLIEDLPIPVIVAEQ